MIYGNVDPPKTKDFFVPLASPSSSCSLFLCHSGNTHLLFFFLLCISFYFLRLYITGIILCMFLYFLSSFAHSDDFKIHECYKHVSIAYYVLLVTNIQWNKGWIYCCSFIYSPIFAIVSIWSYNTMYMMLTSIHTHFSLCPY